MEPHIWLGYVVECSLKTMIDVENKTVPRIHDLHRLQSEVRTLAVLAGSRTRIYLLLSRKP